MPRELFCMSRVDGQVPHLAGVGLKVEGPLDFSQTGVLAALAAPLARVRLSIFVISTYDTDYLLVKRADLENAAAALVAQGHRIRR